MNRFEESVNTTTAGMAPQQQRSYINDFTNLYNMPRSAEGSNMLGFQKQVNQHKATPQQASQSAAQILK